MIIRVSIENTPPDRLFDYSVPKELENMVFVGSRIKAPFARRMAIGFVVEIIESSPFANKLRSITSVDTPTPMILPPLMEIAKWMSLYYYSPIARSIETLIPAPVRTGNTKEKKLLYVEVSKELPLNVKLTARQQELYDDIARVGGGWLSKVIDEFKCTSQILRKMEELGALEISEKQIRRDPLKKGRIIPTSQLPLNEDQSAALKEIEKTLPVNGEDKIPKPILLFGVTGSGKTEVYLQAISLALCRNQGVIVLVPEISLTPQTVQRFASRFGDKIAVLHSALSNGERFDEWQRIRDGKARVVVGPRSAVFAPVENLGLIIVDEEHEPSYKQEEAPRYNARDLAVMRGKIGKCGVVLGSATPSLESWRNAQTGKYTLLKLTKRAATGATMPLVHIVDMHSENLRTGKVNIFSEELLQGIHDRLERGEQIILFLNRRGYSTSLACPACGYVETCERCDIPFTYHKKDDCLRCHICGQWKHTPQKCPQCGDPQFKFTGFGTQRIELLIKRFFPYANIARMDADSTSKKESHDDILNAFKAGKTDILIGTQMIAKGLHFPRVTLVGIINADTSLHLPDFRAAERTFQLLAQVSGRTGRGDIPGEVIIQTYTPDHTAIQMARTENFEGFANEEMPIRKEMMYPPFMRLTTITFTGTAETLTESLAQTVYNDIKKEASQSILISEVCPASLAKADNLYRFQIVLRSTSSLQMTAVIKRVLQAIQLPEQFRISVDVDAHSF